MAKQFNFMHGFLGKKASFLSRDAALVRLLDGISGGAILTFGSAFLPALGLAAVLFSSINGTRLRFKGLISKFGKDSCS